MLSHLLQTVSSHFRYMAVLSKVQEGAQLLQMACVNAAVPTPEPFGVCFRTIHNWPQQV